MMHKLEDILEHYLHERSLSQATITGYRCAVKNAARHGITDISDQQIKDKMIRWREEILSDGSPSTWNNYVRHLRALGNWMVESQKLIEENPFNHISFAKEPKKIKETVKIIDSKKIIELLKITNEKFNPGWFWITLYRTLFYTGMRRKQLINIRLKDLDFENHTLLLGWKGNKSLVERRIPIPEPIEQDLKRLYKEVKASRKSDKAHIGDNQLFNITLFNPAYKGDNMTAEQLSGFFRRLKDYSGINLSPHKLRHTMATEWVKNEGDIKTLQQILGHSDIRTTLDFYVHPDIEQMKKNLSKLPEI